MRGGNTRKGFFNERLEYLNEQVRDIYKIDWRWEYRYCIFDSEEGR